MSAVVAIAVADFRDRMRRRSFLAVLAAAGFLGLQAIQGRVEVALGDYSGEPTSAWAGTLLALVGATFLSLAGFWAVKGSIARDAQTGVGQILAATPIRKLTYTLGKALSHFLVLAAMTGVLALAAVTLILVTPDAGRLDLIAILTPLVWITLPGLAIAAASAVVFETIRFLARGFGNFVWFFAWPLLLVLAMESGAPDLFGIATMQKRLGETVRALDPNVGDSFRIGIGGLDQRATKRFRWDGLELTPDLAARRIGVFGLAVLLASVAAWPFDRFDPARSRPIRTPGRKKQAGAGRRQRSRFAGSLLRTERWSIPALDFGGTRFGRLAGSELRVAVRSMPRWWAFGVVALWLGGLLAPPENRLVWLAIAFAWPAFVWSGLTTRDRTAGVAPLLASAPSPLSRQLPAVVFAGWLVGLACAGGAILGLLVSGDLARAASAVLGCLAMPMLALALGVLTSGPRLFEAIFVTLWYIGPLQRGWPLDFAAISAEAVTALVPLWFLVVALALLGAALVVERGRRATGEARFVR